MISVSVRLTPCPLTGDASMPLTPRQPVPLESMPCAIE